MFIYYSVLQIIILFLAQKFEFNCYEVDLISFSDFVPTLLETVNYQNSGANQTDGLSFYSQLIGDNSQKSDWIYCFYAPNWGKFENAT